MIPTELGFSERYDDDSGVRLGVRLINNHLAFAFPGMEYEVRVDLEDLDFFIKALLAIRESQGFDKLVEVGPEEPKGFGSLQEALKKGIDSQEEARRNDLLRDWLRPGCFPPPRYHDYQLKAPGGEPLY